MLKRGVVKAAMALVALLTAADRGVSQGTVPNESGYLKPEFSTLEAVQAPTAR